MTITTPSPAQQPRPLAGVAGRAVLWAAGSTFVCDAMQFATMLVLVRLLSPSDYGRMALAQTILGFLSVITFTTFAPHALQLRDPSEINWHAHFAAATILNTGAFFLTLVVAGILARTNQYAGAAMPLAVLAVVFLIQIPAIIRQTMVQASHDWARTRGLIIAGAGLSNVLAVTIALAGGGIWALIAGPILNVVPAAVDLFWSGKWRPVWRWNWVGYRDTVNFGLNRVGSTAVLSGRQAVEQTMIAGTYNFSTLGFFTRSIGLATLVGGRIGGLVSASLYPVVTRAERGSPRFRRLAGLTLRGIAWATVPGTVFLSLSAHSVVMFLYGTRWSGVITLLPFAAAQAALSGIAWASYNLLLANNEMRYCLLIDIASAALGTALVLGLVPLGPQVYITGLAVMYLLILCLILLLLRRSGGIILRDVAAALLPPMAASLPAAGALLLIRRMSPSFHFLPFRLALEGVIFSLFFVLTIRLGFRRLLSELLEVVPGGRKTALILLCPTD